MPSLLIKKTICESNQFLKQIEVLAMTISIKEKGPSFDDQRKKCKYELFALNRTLQFQFVYFPLSLVLCGFKYCVSVMSVLTRASENGQIYRWRLNVKENNRRNLSYAIIYKIIHKRQNRCYFWYESLGQITFFIHDIK